MTEQEWLESLNPYQLVEYARAHLSASRTKAGKRRLRLFSCACVRRIWHLLNEKGQRIIELAERLADGEPAGAEIWATLQRDAEQCSPGWAGVGIDDSIRSALAGAVARGSPARMAFLTTMSVASVLGRVSHEKRLEAGETLQAARAAWNVAMAKELEAQAILLRDIFGNPFRPLARRTFPADVRGLAQACYEGNWAVAPMLADALADLGEDAAAAHLRQPAHVRGCHVVDWVRGVA